MKLSIFLLHTLAISCLVIGTRHIDFFGGNWKGWIVIIMGIVLDVIILEYNTK